MIKAGFSIATAVRTSSIKVAFVILAVTGALFAQPPQFKTYTYINAYAGEAINQMVEFRIPASVILAQAIYESSSGTSQLAKKSNNHFGIKCHWQWCGDTIIKHDDTLNECFRRYSSIQESYTDHSLFLMTRPRYAHLFKLPVNDYAGWCRGLKEAGYATLPQYAERLIHIIEETGLYELDGYEYMTQAVFIEDKNKEIRTSKYTGKGFSVKDLSRAGLLWLDAGDIAVRSLDLVVEGNEKQEVELAGR